MEQVKKKNACINESLL
uniref:Uncharacterized protein n=1 Tax=Rhizophora mucronata TaxID=61149 RepID=A0A2P2LPW5_RHIMU